MGRPNCPGSASQRQPDIFDRQAARYDAWYNTPSGEAVFLEELDALAPLLEGLPHPWLEVGVGGGRFAAALGAEFGVDPAANALALAARRGSRVAVARGESLPFPDATFGAVLFTAALCFIPDPVAALRESRRVLRSGGRILLGLIPAEGPWGRHYRALAAEGHAYYRLAHFFARGEMASLFAAVGLRQVRVRSALFRPPEVEFMTGGAREGDDLAAGFAAVLLDVVP